MNLDEELFERDETWKRVTVGCRVRLESPGGKAAIEGVVTGISRRWGILYGVVIGGVKSDGFLWEGDYSIQILEEPVPTLPVAAGYYVIDTDDTLLTPLWTAGVYRLSPATGWTLDGEERLKSGRSVEDHLLMVLRNNTGVNARMTRLVREEIA